MSRSQQPTDSDFKPEEIDPKNSSTTFRCRLCDYSHSSRHSVAMHIAQSTDSEHRDRSASEDPSLIEIEGNELLCEWNERTEFTGDEKVAYDDRDYKVLFEIWCNPNATQREIAEKIGLSTSAVASRINDMDIDWKNRMEAVSDLFPVESASDAGYEREEEEDEENEDVDVDVDENETDELSDRIVSSHGNRSYEGPSTGINLAEGSDKGANPEPQEDAKLRLDAFETLSSRQQATIISKSLHAEDATKSTIAKSAGVDASYLSPSSVPRHAKCICEALQDHIDDGVATVGDLLVRFKDDEGHDHNLDRIIEHTDADVSPNFPPSEDSEESDDPNEVSDARTDGSDVVIGFSHEEAFELLTNSDASDEVLRRIYRTVVSDQ